MPGDGVTKPLPWSVVPCAPGRLYECARWIPEAQVYQWVDILEHSVHRWAPGANCVDSRVLDLEFTTAALPLNAEQSIISSRSSLHILDWTSGALRTIGEWTFPLDVRFNDGAIAPDGTVYIGTMSMDRRRDAAGLFRFADGELVEVLTKIGISNGLGWLPSQDAVHVDSLIPRVRLLDLAQAPHERGIFAELDDTDEPDGLQVTPDGGVLLANWGKSSLLHLTSQGSRRADIPVPARYPTSVAIGGQDLDQLLITTAGAEEHDHTPQSGHVLFTSLAEALV